MIVFKPTEVGAAVFNINDVLILAGFIFLSFAALSRKHLPRWHRRNRRDRRVEHWKHEAEIWGAHLTEMRERNRNKQPSATSSAPTSSAAAD